MGRKKSAVSLREQRRTLALVLSIVCLPLLGAVAAIVSTSHPDLGNLAPLRQGSDDYYLLDWATLQRDHAALRADQHGIEPFTGARIQALGYMADGGEPLLKGAQVSDFVLLPESGNLLHPAHRFGDQMIAVHLGDSERIPFSPMGLAWVWGTLRVLPGESDGSKPLYSIEQARSRPANKEEIQKYFASR